MLVFDKRKPRQKEQHKLWQERGLLERTKHNLQAVIDLTSLDKNISSDKWITLIDARDAIILIINNNKQQMQTIKERIPQ